MSDLVFEVIQEADGGFCPQCLTDSIVTEADTWGLGNRSGEAGSTPLPDTGLHAA